MFLPFAFCFTLTTLPFTKKPLIKPKIEETKPIIKLTDQSGTISPPKFHYFLLL